MRRSHIAVLSLLCLSAASSGCRQTTTGIAGTQLTPVSPLAPNNSLFPAPGSGIGPMGGSTRVPPPPTGSVGMPANNYLSNGVTSQVNQFGTSSDLASVPNHGVVGSGVQNAGWTETGANVSPTAMSPVGYNDPAWASNVTPQTSSPLAASQPTMSNMTMGGMQVIDLTTSPPPPGYPMAYQGAPYQQPLQYPQAQYSQAQIPQAAYSPSPVNIAPSLSPAPGSYDMYPSSDGREAVGGYAPPTNLAVARGFTGPATGSTNSAFENVQPSYPAATSFPPTSATSTVARSIPSTPFAPSTDPAPRTAAAPQDDLQWRRPGSSF